MNGRLAKKIREQAQAASLKRDAKILPELKGFINSQRLGDRIKIAWRILMGRF